LDVEHSATSGTPSDEITCVHKGRVPETYTGELGSKLTTGNKDPNWLPPTSKKFGGKNRRKNVFSQKIGEWA